jgi:hypothetical protein
MDERHTGRIKSQDVNATRVEIDIHIIDDIFENFKDRFEGGCLDGAKVHLYF